MTNQDRNMLMHPMIAGILHFAGPDMMIILLSVFLLFGANKLPELALGLGRAVKEFSAARDEIEKGMTQSSTREVAQAKLLDTKSQQRSAPYSRHCSHSDIRALTSYLRTLHN